MTNVLVVEDSKPIRSMMRVSLEEAGFSVLEAANGFEALRALPTARLDLIVTDINMPDINGLELIGFVRSNPAYKGIPLIIVSTEKSEADKKRGLALGASCYIIKPFPKEELMAAVKKTLAGAK
jgi:two-component system chemotaxis response regulator CheY